MCAMMTGSRWRGCARPLSTLPPMKTLSTPTFWLAVASVVLAATAKDEISGYFFAGVAALALCFTSVLVKLDELSEFLQEEAEFDFEIEDHDDIDLTGLGE